MLAFADQLHTLLTAPYPFVYVVTYEEARAVGLLRQLLGAMRRPTHIFRPEAETDPAAAFDTLVEALTGIDEPSVGIAIDAHGLLDEPARVRRLRVLARRLQTTGGTLVFVSPVRAEPIELARDWTVVDMPLPERDELQATLDIVLGDEAAGDRERLSAAALGLTGDEAHRAFERARHLAGLQRGGPAAFDWEAAIVEEKRRLMQRSSAVEFVPLTIRLDDVGGLSQLKLWVEERRRAFSDDARAFGLPQPKGLLMLGVQGCGKSLAARAVAGFWGLPLLRLDLGALFSGHDAPDDALRDALRAAEAMSPSVLWVDEIEKGFEGDDGATARLLGSLLIWLQEKTSPVFFVATANDVTNLPPELLRRGRFDEVFFVDLPDPSARKHILRIHLQRRGRDPDHFDLAELTSLTDHFSGAELEQVVVSGLYTAFSGSRDLTHADLVVAARQLVPLYAMYETEIKALRTWARGRARHASDDRRLVDWFGSQRRS